MEERKRKWDNKGRSGKEVKMKVGEEAKGEGKWEGGQGGRETESEGRKEEEEDVKIDSDE